ncbi:Asp-tRNA(Asn)/Glu-tRNA(Gln) amidotransferase subunit GatB, partial [candidate division NPL-UPA2 bacterium]|nr:Asp-tRNA(Asn)/Glu-tRNA(Gln) amidotransferase subunit GatB [candidate division NPL-UPA2 bacterium]
MKYEPVIGLEVHAELFTEAKVFCGCSTSFGALANSQACPVCLGLPGVLPVLNQRVVEHALKIALALHCRISPYSRFDRKNYYYPDLPKNYQISQNYFPFADKGYLDIPLGKGKKRVGINNIHLEEDAGKNIHGEGAEADESGVDFNRAGVPLIEIVTEPDMRSLEEADRFMVSLRDILLYLHVCDCCMEEGSLRFEANISLRLEGETQLGNRVEMKNLNSFKIVSRAIQYEMKRQENVLRKGGRVEAETRLWDEKKGATSVMRSKEGAPDYRYFPEPDLPSLTIPDNWMDKARREMPELPEERRLRFLKEYKIPEYDAQVLIADKSLADFYEETVRLFPEAKMVSNWVMGELLRGLREKGIGLEECLLTASHLAGMLNLIKEGTLSVRIAKDVFTEMFNTGKEAEEIVKEKGWGQLSDEKEMRRLVSEIIEKNPRSVRDFRNGKEKALGFFIG